MLFILCHAVPCLAILCRAILCRALPCPALTYSTRTEKERAVQDRTGPFLDTIWYHAYHIISCAICTSCVCWNFMLHFSSHISWYHISSYNIMWLVSILSGHTTPLYCSSDVRVLQTSVYYVGVTTCLLDVIATSNVLSLSWVSLTIARIELKFKCLIDEKLGNELMWGGVLCHD